MKASPPLSRFGFTQFVFPDSSGTGTNPIEINASSISARSELTLSGAGGVCSAELLSGSVSSMRIVYAIGGRFDEGRRLK